MLKVSCLCPTYNRASSHIHLVEEAVESFLRQDYPSKELIVLNDTPGQILQFDHPQVRMVNTPFRCASLGDKRNLLVGLASGELLCPWDDDDISLPWRLTRCVTMLGDADYYNPKHYWFLEPGGLHHEHAMGYAFNASICRKSAWNALGGSPSISMGEDAAMNVKLRTLKVANSPPPPLAEWSYIYRWGVSPNHLSSVQGDTYYDEIARKAIERGVFHLEPHWRQDYLAMTREHLAADAVKSV